MKRFALLLALAGAAFAGSATARPVAGSAVDADGRLLKSSCSLARLDAGDPGASVLDCVISDGRTPRPPGPADSATVLLTPDQAPTPGLQVVAGAARSGAAPPTNLALRVLVTDPPTAAAASDTEIWLAPPPPPPRRR